MPSINFHFIEYCKRRHPTFQFNTFVESGTWHGETIFEVERYFKQLYTIEIKKELYEEAKERYSGNKITFINGDSSIEMSKLVKDLNENVIFFLDGHWSKMDTGMGTKEIPLIEEIEAINNDFKQAAIIIIDDLRLFGCGPNLEGDKYHDVDWSYISEEQVINKIKDRIIDCYYLPSGCAEKDRLIINIKPL